MLPNWPHPFVAGSIWPLFLVRLHCPSCHTAWYWPVHSCWCTFLCVLTRTSSSIRIQPLRYWKWAVAQYAEAAASSFNISTGSWCTITIAIVTHYWKRTTITRVTYCREALASTSQTKNESSALKSYFLSSKSYYRFIPHRPFRNCSLLMPVRPHPSNPPSIHGLWHTCIPLTKIFLCII